MTQNNMTELARLQALAQNAQTPNALQLRFAEALQSDYTERLALAARSVGLNYNGGALQPHTLTETTEAVFNTQADPDTPIALNVDRTSDSLRFYFQDAAFIVGCTITCKGVRLTDLGQPDVTFQGNASVTPEDYVYGQIRRDGSGDTFQSDKMPLSQIANTDFNGPLFHILPCVRPGGSVLFDLSIIPPNGIFNEPPYVQRVAEVSIAFHTMRFDPVVVASQGAR